MHERTIAPRTLKKSSLMTMIEMLTPAARKESRLVLISLVAPLGEASIKRPAAWILQLNSCIHLF